jgi:hypothetical protein
MVTILRLLLGALRDCIKSRRRLEAEAIVLRHQLNVLRRLSPRRVRPNAFDRALFVCLYRYFPDIGNAVAIIRPETVIRWHRMGFRGGVGSLGIQAVDPRSNRNYAIWCAACARKIHYGARRESTANCSSLASLSRSQLFQDTCSEDENRLRKAGRHFYAITPMELQR